MAVASDAERDEDALDALADVEEHPKRLNPCHLVQNGKRKDTRDDTCQSDEQIELKPTFPRHLIPDFGIDLQRYQTGYSNKILIKWMFSRGLLLSRSKAYKK